MAYDKLVDSSQLNSDLGDVADAIRAKSGGSSQLAFPSGFISEIGSISTGGGGSSGGMKLLYETAPTTEQVSAIKVDFTSDVLGYDFYRIVLLGTFTGSAYPYVGINTETNTAYLNPFPTQPSNSRFECYIVKVGSGYNSMIGSRPAAINGDLSYIHARAYNANTVFNVGFVVQIWGCNYENS